MPPGPCSTTGAAIEAAAHAEAQLEFGRKLGQAEGAAYLQFQSGEIREAHRHFYIDLCFANVGKSPATGATIANAKTTIQVVENSEFAVAMCIAQDTLSIAPGGAEKLQATLKLSDDSSEEAIFNFIYGGSEAEVIALINWDDTLENRHAMEIKFAISE